MPAGWRPEAGRFEVSAHAFARANGREIIKIYEGIILGFLPGGNVVRKVPGGVKAIWVVHLETPEQRLSDFLDRLVTNWPGLRSIAEFRWFDRCLEVCGVGSSFEVPDSWVDDYIALPDAHDFDNTLNELRSVRSGLTGDLIKLGRRIELRRHGVIGPEWIAPIEGDPIALLSEVLGKDVPELTFTCLEPIVGAARPKPSPHLVGRLISIEGPMRDVAIADTCDAMANCDLVRDFSIPLMHWRMSKVLSGVERGDHRCLRRRIRAYLDGRILRTVPPRARVSDVFGWMACEARMSQWASEPVSDELRDWLLENKPEVPRDLGFLKMVLKAEARVTAAGKRGRKVRSDLIAAGFDDWLAEAEANHACASLAKAEFAKAHAAAGEEPNYRHSYAAPLLDAQARDTGELMLVNIRSVSVSWLMGLFRNKCREEEILVTSTAFLSRHSPGGRHHDPEFWNSRVIIYDGVERLGGGPVPPEPVWARCFKSSALLPCGDLPTEIIERRRQFFADTGIVPDTQVRRGLLRSDATDVRSLMKWALALFDWPIVTIDEYHRGISIARCHYRILAKRLVRAGISMQMVDDEEKWTKIDTDFGERPAILAVPKLPHDQRLRPYKEKVAAFGIDFDTFKIVGDLISMTVAADGGDPDEPTRLAVVKPALNLPMDCSPDRYVLQFRGRPLEVWDLAFCMSHLFGRRVLSHDVRDGGSGRSYADGRTVSQVARTTGHRRAKTAKSYIRRGNGQMPGQGKRTLASRDAAELLGKPGANKR